MADMIIVNELAPGKIFTKDNQIYAVIDRNNNKTAMRQMIIKIKVKNLRTGTINEMSFTGGDKVEVIYLDKKKMNYSYDDGSSYVFMDNETYDQISVPHERLEDKMKYIKDNSEVTITFYGSEILGIELPAKVALKIVETTDAVKGDTINNPRKDATLETGLVVKVPMFIKNGEEIYVNTIDGTYDNRVNK